MQPVVACTHLPPKFLPCLCRRALELTSTTTNPASAGSNFEWALTASTSLLNDAPISEVRLVVPMPEAILASAVDPAGPTCMVVAGGTTVACNLGTLAVGTTQTVRITASAAVPGVFFSTAIHEGTDIDPTGTKLTLLMQASPSACAVVSLMGLKMKFMG